jgi:hypothetical protein
MRSLAVGLASIGLALLACSERPGGGAAGAGGGGGVETGNAVAGAGGGGTRSDGQGGAGVRGPDAGDGAGAGGGAAAADAGVAAADAGTADTGDGGGAGTGGGGPSSCLAPWCTGQFAMLFASEQLPSFYLSIPDGDGDSLDDPDSWTQLAACGRNDLAGNPPPPQCEYQPARFHVEYDPNPLDDIPQNVQSPVVPIGIRLKGRASYRAIDDKPAFKIKFTEGQGERFAGLSRLTLNNAMQDPSGIRERMAYLVYRNAGIEAPLANNARVYVQRGTAAFEYYGLYTNVQTLDRRFVEDRFGEVAGEVGNLYDTKNYRYFSDFDRSVFRDQAGPAPGAQEERFQLETNDADPDTADLTAAIDAVYVEDVEAGAGQFLAGATPVIDVDQWLRVAAAQALLADWDGFAGARNNYEAYHDLVRGTFVILPWGTDQTFGITGYEYRPNWHYPLDHTQSERTPALFLLRCLRDAVDCGASYDAIVAEVTATFDEAALLAEVDHAFEQIEAAMYQDTRRPHDDAEFVRSVQHVRHFIEHRAACVDQLLAQQACELLTCPLGYELGCRDW